MRLSVNSNKEGGEMGRTKICMGCRRIVDLGYLVSCIDQDGHELLLCWECADKWDDGKPLHVRPKP